VSRPDWSTYFLGIAEAVAERSDCRRAKVGAVIVDMQRRIISTGYPGTVPGKPGCLDGACPRGKLSPEECPPGTPYDNCISQHAEVNALLRSDYSRHTGGTIYITREPCNWCRKLIAASGLHRAVWRAGKHGAWHEESARELVSHG
jgi:dCMP deaminase